MKKRILRVLGIFAVACILFSGCAKNNSGDATTDTDNPEAVSDVDINVDGGDDSQNADLSETDDGKEGGSTEEQSDIDDDESGAETGSGEEIDILDAIAAQVVDIPVKIIISNLTGVDIGMISIIDPYTDEQNNMGELPADTAISLDMDWPSDKTVFEFAIYNVNGELVSISEVDVTGISRGVEIQLTGNNDLEKIDSVVK